MCLNQFKLLMTNEIYNKFKEKIDENCENIRFKQVTWQTLYTVHTGFAHYNYIFTQNQKNESLFRKHNKQHQNTHKSAYLITHAIFRITTSGIKYFRYEKKHIKRMILVK